MTADQSPTASALLFLHSQTPLHPGAGTALGVVDLPVQRERHTQWPIIPGSSVKGVLRDACRRRDDNAMCETVFGPETKEADKFAGALSVTDARILAFPVRSLQGVFAYVTSPGVLRRLQRDIGLTGSRPALTLPESIPCGTFACADDSPLLVDGKEMVLEEYHLERTPFDGTRRLAEQLAQWVTDDEGLQHDLTQRLVILDDNQFTHFVRHGTEVVARIGLDYERKTVAKGALFYQEFLPSETILYAVVLANAARSDTEASAQEVLEYLNRNTPAVLQFGGDETTGKGFCHVHSVTIA